jgi:hypothetical protein
MALMLNRTHGICSSMIDVCSMTDRSFDENEGAGVAMLGNSPAIR